MVREFFKGLYIDDQPGDTGQEMIQGLFLLLMEEQTQELSRSFTTRNIVNALKTMVALNQDQKYFTPTSFNITGI